MDKLKPKIDAVSADKGSSNFEKLCSVAFLKEFIDPNDISKGIINNAVIICLNEQETEENIKKFKDDFISHYTNSINSTNELLKLQQYEDKLPVNVQFYDPSVDINGPIADLPQYFANFNQEGLVLMSDKSSDPSKVKFSFRFDQILNCRGTELKAALDSLDKKVSTMIKPSECCVAYTVDWNLKPLNDIFCSPQNKPYKCKVEAKLFQTTTYSRCISAQVMKLMELLKETNGNLEKANITIIKRSQMIQLLNEISKFNISKYYSKQTKTYKIIQKILPHAQKHLHGLLQGLANETNGKTTSTSSSKTDLVENIKRELLTQATTNKITAQTNTTVKTSSVTSSKSSTSTSTSTSTQTPSSKTTAPLTAESMVEKMQSFAQGKIDSKTMTNVENLIKTNPTIFNDLYKSGFNITIDAIEKMGNSGDTGILEKIVHDKSFQIIRNPYTNKTDVKCPGNTNKTVLKVKPIKPLNRTNQNPKSSPSAPAPKPKIVDKVIDYPENPEFNSDDDFNSLKINCSDTTNGGKIPSLIIQKNKTINLPLYSKAGNLKNFNNETLDNLTNSSNNSSAGPIIVNSSLTANDIPMSLNTGIISKEDSLKMRNLYNKRGINNPSSSILDSVVKGDSSDGIPSQHKIESSKYFIYIRHKS